MLFHADQPLRLTVSFPLAVLLSLVIVFVSGLASSASRVPWDQSANVAPLPGCGFPISISGETGDYGLLHANVPCAYTPSRGTLEAAIFRGDYITPKDEAFGNGSAFVGYGFSREPRVYASLMATDGGLDNGLMANAQVQISEESDSVPAVSVGIQDAFETEKGNSSAYIVVTKSVEAGLESRTYLTAGYGGGRFTDSMFAAVSQPLGKYTTAFCEYDGYQANYGIGFRLPEISENLCATLAYNGKAGWLVGLGYSDSINRK